MSSGSATSTRPSGATTVTRQKPVPPPDGVAGAGWPVVVAAAWAVMLTFCFPS